MVYHIDQLLPFILKIIVLYEILLIAWNNHIDWLLAAFVEIQTAESLRIKGLAENPRSYDEMSSHGARFSSSSLGSQVSADLCFIVLQYIDIDS